MLERLFMLVVAIGPIALLLIGIASVAVGLSWVVNAIWGRAVQRPFGPLPKSEAPEPSRAPAVGTGAMAVGLAVVAVKLAPKPEAIVWAVVATVLAVVTVVVLVKPPISPKW